MGKWGFQAPCGPMVMGQLPYTTSACEFPKEVSSDSIFQKQICDFSFPDFLYQPARNQTLESSLTFSLSHPSNLFLPQVPWIPSQYFSINTAPSHHCPLHHLLWFKLTAPLTCNSIVASKLIESPLGNHSALPWLQSILFKIQVCWFMRYLQPSTSFKILDAIFGTHLHWKTTPYLFEIQVSLAIWHFFI